jgi:hypothetical protein
MRRAHHFFAGSTAEGCSDPGLPAARRSPASRPLLGAGFWALASGLWALGSRLSGALGSLGLPASDKGEATLLCLGPRFRRREG